MNTIRMKRDIQNTGIGRVMKNLIIDFKEQCKKTPQKIAVRLDSTSITEVCCRISEKI